MDDYDLIERLKSLQKRAEFLYEENLKQEGQGILKDILEQLNSDIYILSNGDLSEIKTILSKL